MCGGEVEKSLEMLLLSGAKADDLWSLHSEKSSGAESYVHATAKLMIRLDRLRCGSRLSCEAEPPCRLALAPIFVCIIVEHVYVNQRLYKLLIIEKYTFFIYIWLKYKEAIVKKGFKLLQRIGL
jgi:hypothetical protein